MTDKEVKECHGDATYNMIAQIDAMEWGEQKSRAIADLEKMERMLNEFSRIDLEEQKDLRKCEIEKEKAKIEAETTLNRKERRKKERTENAFKILGIATPLIATVTCELFRVHNLNKGYAFELRDNVQTSQTFRPIWQDVGKAKPVR